MSTQTRAVARYARAAVTILGVSRTGVVRLPAAGCLALALTALLAFAPARASAVAWSALYKAQCCYMTLESGEVATQWFEFTNVGTSTWTNDVVDLGTSQPRDRSSAFAVPGHWSGANRPTRLDQPFVNPGGVGRFSFLIRAPQVPIPIGFREFFEPVAEFRAWMNAVVFLDYLVLPARAPSVKISSAPRSVRQRDPIPVVAIASDNHVVDHVTISVDGVSRTLAGPTGPYAATLGSSTLAVGTHTLIARATDAAGNSAQASTVLTVLSAADGDGDGVADALDRCPQRKGGRYDRDHDGCPGPYRRMSLRPSVQWAIPAHGIQLTLLALSGVPAGGRVRLDCARCHVHELHRLRLGRRGHTIRLTRITGPALPAGAAIVMRVTAPGYIGRYLRYTVLQHGSSLSEIKRANRRPLRRVSHCLPPGSIKPADHC